MNSVLDANRIARDFDLERPAWEALLPDCVAAYQRA